MLPNWLWTFIIVAIMLPLHLMVIGPAAEGASLEIRLSVAVGYLALGILWGVAGSRLKMVRR